MIGPHPDDELLGCGGLLLRRASEGNGIAWVLMTAMESEPPALAAARASEIEIVRRGLNIAPEDFVECGFPTTKLDTSPMSEVVNFLAQAIKRLEPTEVLIPSRVDVHSDHRITFDAAIAATKWFRQPSVRRILAYETLSETDAGYGQEFQPRYFADISLWLDQKIELLRTYRSELGEFPFPRSEESVRALAALRGSQAGFVAAEAFDVVRWRDDLEVDS